MPAAAKVWNRHIVGSPLYNFVRSKLPASTRPSLQGIPSDLEQARVKVEAQKRRRGQYSIATLLASLRSQSHWTGGTDNATDNATKNETELTMVREFRECLDQRFGDDDGFSVRLGDPSKPERSPNDN